MCFFAVKLIFKDISCEKLHMLSILGRYGFRWHSGKPYRTRLRLTRYGLSECHLNPYRTRMYTICISYQTTTLSQYLNTQLVIVSCFCSTQTNEVISLRSHKDCCGWAVDFWPRGRDTCVNLYAQVRSIITRSDPLCQSALVKRTLYFL